CLRRQINAQAGCIRALMQQREEKAARSRPEIKDARVRNIAEQHKRGLDQRFTVRARIKRRGSNGEGKPPELPLAQNARHRLARETAALIFDELCDFCLCHTSARLAQHLDVARTRDTLHKKARVKLRRRKPGLTQPPAEHSHRMIARFDDHASSSIAASRAVCSSTTSAPISSPSPSPSRS